MSVPNIALGNPPVWLRLDSRFCYAMTFGDFLTGRMAMTLHIPVLWRCECQRMFWFCRLCNQVLTQDRCGYFQLLESPK